MKRMARTMQSPTAPTINQGRAPSQILSILVGANQLGSSIAPRCTIAQEMDRYSPSRATIKPAKWSVGGDGVGTVCVLLRSQQSIKDVHCPIRSFKPPRAPDIVRLVPAFLMTSRNTRASDSQSVPPSSLQAPCPLSEPTPLFSPDAQCTVRRACSWPNAGARLAVT